MIAWVELIGRKMLHLKSNRQAERTVFITKEINKALGTVLRREGTWNRRNGSDIAKQIGKNATEKLLHKRPNSQTGSCISSNGEETNGWGEKGKKKILP